MAARVLLTGASGMIGAALARRLLEDGDALWALARAGSDRSRVADVSDRIRWIAGDVRDAEAVRRAVAESDPSLVYHLASTPFNPPTIPAAEHEAVIVRGTLHVLEALRGRPGVRVIGAGSAAEYGSGEGLRESDALRPGTVLGAAKASAGLLAQAYARAYGLETVWLRIFTPYGPGEAPSRLIPQAIASALEGRPIRMTSGLQQRDYFYIDDLIEAMARAGRRPLEPGSVINLGSGRGVPVREVVERVIALVGGETTLELGALATRPDEIMVMAADIGRAKRALDWSPAVALDEGLRRTIEWGRGLRPRAACGV